MSSFTSKKIIVPWDFSERSEKALAKAFEIADSPEQIEIVHVTIYPSSVEPSVVWGVYSEDEIRKSLIQSFHDELPSERYANIKFNAMFGDPGSQITELAEERDAGLIVISSHGRTGLTRMLLGSVAERVVRLAHCPVLVLRG